jgi:hypothetical protein
MSFGFGGSGSSMEQQQISSNAYNQNGSTQRTLTPDQLAAQTQLTQIIHALSTNPQQFLAPAQNQARNQVNDNYSGLADSLRQQFMANPGGGSSGKYGQAALQGDLARRRSLSDVDTGFAEQQAAAPLTAAQLSEQLLGMNMGTTTTNAGTSSGVNTGTGSSKDFKGSFAI